MTFTLETKIQAYPFKLSEKDRSLLLGSCFSEHMGQKMYQSGLHVLSNPTGILFNPVSIAETLLAISGQSDFPFEAVSRDGVWCSLHQHSKIYSASETELLKKVEQVFIDTRRFFEQTEFCFITFGTAYVHLHRPSGRVVANCQKQPSNLFKKQLLSVDEIVGQWSELVKNLPGQRFVFTVSPVRHSKEGLFENNLSKGTLLLAVKKLLELFPDRCFYFPAYEIVVDELRDYRFFERDLVHPNGMAVDYVWEKFCVALITEKLRQSMKSYHTLVSQLAHRPMMLTDKNLHAYRGELTDHLHAFKTRHKEMNMSYLISLYESSLF